MSQPDGSIVFSTALDNSDLEKQYQQLVKKVKKLEDTIHEKKRKHSPLVEEAKALGREYDTANKKLQLMRNGPGWHKESEITDQQVKVNEIAERWDEAGRKADALRTEIFDATQNAEQLKEKAGEVAEKLAEASQGSAGMGEAIKRASKKMDKFTHRLKNLMSRVFVFTVITKALQSMRSWMGNVIKSSDKASAAIARLKGAFLTLMQPIINTVIPVLTTVVDVLTRIVSVIAQIVSMIFGTTAQASSEAAEALYDQADAYGETGKEAKKAGKILASFDEINTLSSNEDAGAGGASTGNGIKPDFDLGDSLSEEKLRNILTLITLIGAALLAWKLADSFVDGIRKFFGILIAIQGAVMLAKGAMDAWNNGVNMDNLWKMLLGTLLLAAGLGLAFGAVGAAIGLIIGGLVMLVTAFRDADKNGISLENTLLAIAGIMALGIGIGILTGSWIPVLIAAIASVLLAIANAFGEGENLIAGVKRILNGFLDFFVGIFTGDIERAIGGIGNIFGGMKDVIGAILDALSKMFTSFFDWLDKKTGGKITGIIKLVKKLLVGAVGWIKNTLFNLIDAAQQIIEGIVIFLSGVFSGDWDKAWQGIVKIVKGAINLLISAIEGFVNFFVMAINAVLGAINTISVDVPDWVPLVGGKTFGFNIPEIPKLNIPRLAAGAVIPPNREFLAVLGDQKSGMNIETPLATMVDAFKTAITEMDSGAPKEIVLRLSAGRSFVRDLKFELDTFSKHQGVKLVQSP